jgi:dihydroxyacetone kinase-like predicted kinase
MYRMHIHVPDQTEYEPIEYIKSLGTITNIAIENLMVQMAAPTDAGGVEGINLESIEPGQIAVVAVAPGPGIARVLASLGVAALVEGGQTMNPSTQEILAAFENLPTDKVIILPNNKNIILAANQAAELTVKEVAVIPTRSIPQGIAAMFAYDRENEFERTVQGMQRALEEIRSAEITTATRSVEIDGVQVSEGQIIALLDGHLAAAGDEMGEVLFETLRRAEVANAELITFYYGADLNNAQANQLADLVRSEWPEQEVEVLEGGQPHYMLILSIE